MQNTCVNHTFQQPAAGDLLDHCNNLILKVQINWVTDEGFGQRTRRGTIRIFLGCDAHLHESSFQWSNLYPSCPDWGIPDAWARIVAQLMKASSSSNVQAMHIYGFDLGSGLVYPLATLTLASIAGTTAHHYWMSRVRSRVGRLGQARENLLG